MTNKKTTKQQLVASIVLLFMCFSMLLGTTFAWFTDSVTSAGNIIKTGTLDVEMYWAEGKEDPNASATVWADASKGPMFNYELWEPGYVAARQIKIANKGTLDLKYNLNIVANGEVSELADVIDVYFIDPAAQLADRTALAANKKIGTLTEVLAGINTGKLGTNTLKAGDDAVVTIALKMQETAGNEYQDLGIGSSFSIQLLATQMASEKDSFDNQYDNGAYNTIVYDAAQLKSALEQGGSIIVAGEMNADGTFTVPFNSNRQTEYLIDAENVDSLNGGKYVLDDAANWGFTVVVDEGQTLSLSDMDITADSAWAMNMINNGTLKLSNINLVAANGAGVYAYGAKGTTTLDNLKVNHVNLSDPSAPWAATAVATSSGHNMIINGGTYVGSTYGVFVYNSGGKVTINGGTFKAPYVLAADGSYSDKNIRGELYVNGGNFDGKINMTNGHAYCEINGGTFTNFSVSTYNPVVIKGGTFDADPSAYVADGFKAIENNGTYVVVPENIDAVILTAADLLALSAKSFTANNGVAESYTIMLGADIDMNGADFSAIIAQRGDTLTFIGNGHIISNVNIISGADDNTTGQASMFYVYPNSTLNVSDLILKDITVTADANSTGYAAAVIGYCEGTAILNNVDVVNATIVGAKSSGALAGHVGNGGNITATNCDVSATVTLSSYEANGHYAGKYLGTMAGDITLNKCTADVTVSGNLNANNIGDIYGRKVSGNLTIDGKTVTSNAADVVNGGNFVLSGNVQNNSAIKNDTSIDLNGNTFEATGTVTLTGNADLTMANGDYVVNGTYGHIDVRPDSAEGSTLLFENVDFSYNMLNKTYGPSTNRLGTVVEICATAADAKSVVVFRNCTFTNAQVLIEGMSGKTGIVDVTFENCTFNALTSSAPIFVQNYVTGKVTVTGCTFNLECTSSTASAISISSSSSTVIELIASNNTINATAATPSGENGTVEQIKVNGTPANIKFISAYDNATVTETGTVKSGIAK